MQRRFSRSALGVFACLFLFAGALSAQTDAVVGVPYTYDATFGIADALNAIPSTPGVEFSFSFTFGGGVLPPGLSLKPSGLVSGTPTTPGRYDFTILFNFRFTISGFDLPPGFEIPATSIPFPSTIVVTGSAGPKLSVQPGGLSFSFTAGAAPSSQVISVANQGDQPRSFSASASVSSGGDWLTVSGGGPASPFGQSPATVTANPARLPAGTYVGSIAITFAPGSERFDIPVVMTISSAQQSISLSQTGLTFRALAGGSAPPAQSFSVLNGGGSALSWTAATSTLSGGSAWLSATPASGRSDATSSPAIQVRVSPAGLAPGDYYGQLQISADGVANSPQSVSVVLTVVGSDVALPPVVQPTGLVFVGQVGATNVTPQNVEITNLTTKDLSLTTTSFFEPGNNWFTAPKIGTAKPGQPLRLAIQPVLTGLAAGVYRGELTTRFTETGATRRIDILLIVIPRPTSSAKPDASLFALGCAPTKLIPIFTQLGASFTTTAAWPTSLELRVVDDCGDPMIAGSVVVTFSSGDPLVALTSLRDGRWTGAWQARNAGAAPVTITAKAQLTSPNLAGTAVIGGNVQPNASAPVIAAGGAVSPASFARLAPLAPGSLVRISGSNLAQGSTLATELPLKTELNGTQVLLAGRSMPLRYASDGQIDAVVPFDVPINATQQMIVRRAASYSGPEPIIIAAAQPAIFTKDGSGKGAALLAAIKPDGTQFIVDADNPVTEGDTVVISCAGLGPVDPPIAAGAAAPADAPSQTVNPVTVTIGGQSATVVSAVLASNPELTGVYQVKVTVPPGITPAPDAPLIVTVADQSSQPVTIAVKAAEVI
jgi:uncharacterized protein (TIGR03437 family)